MIRTTIGSTAGTAHGALGGSVSHQCLRAGLQPLGGETRQKLGDALDKPTSDSLRLGRQLLAIPGHHALNAL